MITNHLIPSALSREEISQETRLDPTLSQIIKWTQGKGTGNLGPFKGFKEELSMTSDGMLLKGDKIIIPTKLQAKILKTAHQGHQGMVRTKQLLRQFVWFPNIDQQVQEAIKHCKQCQINTAQYHTIQPLNMSEMPSGPWEELSIDFYGPLSNGKYLLVLVDDYSRYPIVKVINSTAAKTVIPVLDEILAMFGIPVKIRSDNEPPFNSANFSDFAKQMGFRHHRVTPLWPRANGICERFMRNLGKILRNASASTNSFETELLAFLRNYRATPHSSTQIPPNELLFETYSTTACLPNMTRKAASPGREIVNDSQVKEKMRVYGDLHLKTTVSSLEVGDWVLLKQLKTNKASTTYLLRGRTIRNSTLEWQPSNHKKRSPKIDEKHFTFKKV